MLREESFTSFSRYQRLVNKLAFVTTRTRAVTEHRFYEFKSLFVKTFFNEQLAYIAEPYRRGLA